MWFDASAALPELGEGREKDAHPSATPATSATPAQCIAPNVANVASVATPPAQKMEPDRLRQGGAGVEIHVICGMHQVDFPVEGD